MKNIMLLFLSEMHLKPDNREIHTVYVNENGKEFDCIQTNESAVKYMIDYLGNIGEQLDGLFFFSTKKLKEKIAVRNGVEEFSIKTHEECFVERILQSCPVLRNHLYTIDYDENKATEESIRQVASMAECIKDYCNGVSENAEEICLHADMTGGFRHASMMMMSVIQLLKYSGVHIGRVLYSNFQQKKIEDVTEVHRMFTLLSGTDEFVNFGSIREIDEYFVGREKSSALKKLLDTMRDFYDAIKICRTHKIETVVKDLGRNLNRFKAVRDKSLPEGLFEQIIDIVKKEYGSLLTTEATRFDIIVWCVKNEFLQQAMTLCTEWMPEYIVDNKICYADDVSVQKECRKMPGKTWRSWKQNLIIDYYKGAAKNTNVPRKKPRNDIAYALQEYIEHNGSREALSECSFAADGMNKFFDECERTRELFQALKDRRKDKDCFLREAPMQAKICRVLWARNCKNPTYKKTYKEFILSQTQESVFRQIDTFSLQDFAAAFSFVVEKDDKEDKKIPKGMTEEQHWVQRENQYRTMFANGIVKSGNIGEALKGLKGYYLIRKERNQINHANSTADKGNEEIKELILSTVGILQAAKR